MGSFETYVYSAGSWSDRANAPEYLSIAVHDSSFATVTYAPAPPTLGLAYLGFQPRDYFDDATASADVDLDGEAEGLASWARKVLGNGVAADEIQVLLAADGIQEPTDHFVEDTARRLLEMLGVVLPPDLAV